jgi:DNA replication protein DnaC
MEHSCKVVYYSAIQLFQTISSYLFDKDKALITELNQTLYESDLLVIDDLGSEMTNDFVRSQLFGILNERIIRQKSTIITTNFSYENLREKYQERIFSRIIKEFEPVKLSGRGSSIL